MLVPMPMLLRVAGSLVVASLMVPGCGLGGFGPAAEEGPDPANDDDFAPQVGFGGTIWGAVSMSEGLDPARLQVGAFRTRQSVSVMLDNGDLDDEDVRVTVSFREPFPVLSHAGPTAPTGIDHYRLEPDVLAMIAMADDDPSHPFDLTLPEDGEDEYIVLAWYDDDGDGRLALTLDGPGSETSAPLQKLEPLIAPDYRMVLELISWREDGDRPVWFGSAAGPEGPDGFAHEDSLHRLGPDAWEVEIPTARR